jgi:hypothetical protein
MRFCKTYMWSWICFLWGPEDDPVKVETCRPVYVLFNVYEINRCVIDWHNCIFYSKLCFISLWIKPTDALNSKFIGITTLHVSGSLSAHHQEFLAVHRHWYILCNFDDRLLPVAGWNSILLLVANDHQNCIKCTSTDVRLRTPDDGRKGCPQHVDSYYQ